ncbi:hypothetical protein M231_03348 [Tremella mesenterica]|uniref:Uncharacterized protein n=1 Tax=Tremella mesenterica TaxID=5217 RepID=A0A4Q1BNE5_TREME|nr:hypothetical protein M231_03348 [Tremella mesenterica]
MNQQAIPRRDQDEIKREKSIEKESLTDDIAVKAGPARDVRLVDPLGEVQRQRKTINGGFRNSSPTSLHLWTHQPSHGPSVNGLSKTGSRGNKVRGLGLTDASSKSMNGTRGEKGDEFRDVRGLESGRLDVRSKPS